MGDGYYEIRPDGYRYDPCANPAPDPLPGTLTYYTKDSAFLRLDVQHDQDLDWTNNSWTLYFPDGRRIAWDTSGESFYDSNNNRVDMRKTIFDGTLHDTIYDEFGRKIIFETGPTTNCLTNQDCIYSYGTNSQEMITRISYTFVGIAKTYQCNDPYGNPCSPIDRTLVLPLVIALPAAPGTTQTYTFEYNAGGTLNGFGEVSSVTVPSGASATYRFAQDGQSNVPWRSVINNALTSKKLRYLEEYDGTNAWVDPQPTWTYVFADTSSTVTAPDGGVTTHSFTSQDAEKGLVTRTELPGGRVVEQVWAENRPAGASVSPTNNPYVKTQFTSLKDSGGALVKTAILDFAYDKNGNVTQVDSYDWVAYSAVTRENGVPTCNPTCIPQGAVRQSRILNTYHIPPATPLPDAGSPTPDPRVYHEPTSSRLKNALISTETWDAVNPLARTEFTYDSSTTTGNLTQQRSWDSTKDAYSDPLGSGNSISVTHLYNIYGDRELTTDARGTPTRFVYGQVQSFTNLYVTQVDYAYSAQGYPEHRRATFDYDLWTGRVKAVTDADNLISTVTTYDVFGRATKIQEAYGTPLERQTAIEYSDTDRRVVVRSSLETATDGKLVTVRHYDQLGRIRLQRQLESATQCGSPPTEQNCPATAGIKVQTRYKITTGANYVLVSNPYRADYSSGESGASMGWTLTTLDQAGRASEVGTFQGAAAPAPWGGNSTSTGIGTAEFNAEQTTITDQAGRKRRSALDALGRLITVVEDPVTLAYPTTYAYSSDDRRNITTVTQGVQTRTLSNDSLGRLWQASNPESGTVCYGTYSQGNCTASYDGNGNLLARTDARGVITTMTYDRLNRPTGRSYSDDTPPVTYCYDGASTESCTGGPVPPNYAKGKLTFIKSATSTYGYKEFDVLGRVTQTTQTTPPLPAIDMVYAYNLAGGLISERYPSLRTVATTYDVAGRVSGVTGYASGFTYSAAGALQQFMLGNGLRQDAQFNSRFQPTSITLTNPATSTQLLGLTLDFGTTANNGNLLGQTIAATGLTAISQKYDYDALNRLTVAVENPGGSQVQCPHPSGSAWCEQYGYDRYGNRWVADFTGLTQQAVTPRGESWFNPYFNAGQPSTWNRAETNRILFNQYDNAGNQTSAGGAAFSYDAENRQTSVLLTAPQSGLFGYTYDGDGFRVKRLVYGMETVYFHDAFGRVVTEYRNGQWFKDYVYLGGQLLAVENAQGRSYVTTDHLGSTRIVTDSSGNVHSRHDYLPFGKEVPPDIAGRADVTGYLVSGWSPAHRVSEAVLQRFTGQEVDPETGLEHFMFRYYSGRQGRFTSADPLGIFSADLGEPQSLNEYAYVLNNPLLYTDPLGLAYWWSGNCLYLTEYAWVESGGTRKLDSVDVYLIGCYVTPLGRLNPDSNPPRSGRGGLPGGGGATTQVPANDGPSRVGCFVRGLVNGGIATAAVAIVTAGVAAVAAPEVVTAGLLIAGGAGAALFIRDFMHSGGAGRAYDAGSLVGGVLVGGATTFGVRKSITGETHLPAGLIDFLGIKKVIDPRGGITKAFKIAFKKGPDLLGGAAALLGAGSGASLLGKGDCQ